LAGPFALCGNLLRWRGVRRSAQSGATQRYGEASGLRTEFGT
jgi:hypothetical protein